MVNYNDHLKKQSSVFDFIKKPVVEEIKQKEAVKVKDILLNNGTFTINKNTKNKIKITSEIKDKKEDLDTEEEYYRNRIKNSYKVNYPAVYSCCSYNYTVHQDSYNNIGTGHAQR